MLKGVINIHKFCTNLSVTYFSNWQSGWQTDKPSQTHNAVSGKAHV